VRRSSVSACAMSDVVLGNYLRFRVVRCWTRYLAIKRGHHNGALKVKYIAVYERAAGREMSFQCGLSRIRHTNQQ